MPAETYRETHIETHWHRTLTKIARTRARFRALAFDDDPFPGGIVLLDYLYLLALRLQEEGLEGCISHAHHVCIDIAVLCGDKACRKDVVTVGPRRKGVYRVHRIRHEADGSFVSIPIGTADLQQTVANIRQTLMEIRRDLTVNLEDIPVKL